MSPIWLVGWIRCKVACQFLPYLGGVVRVHVVTALLNQTCVPVQMYLVLVILRVDTLHVTIGPGEYVLIFHKQHYQGQLVGCGEIFGIFTMRGSIEEPRLTSSNIEALTRCDMASSRSNASWACYSSLRDYWSGSASNGHGSVSVRFGFQALKLNQTRTEPFIENKNQTKPFMNSLYLNQIILKKVKTKPFREKLKPNRTI